MHSKKIKGDKKLGTKLERIWSKINQIYCSVIKEHDYYKRLEKKIPAIELALISGPTLVGWLIGILKYPKEDVRFRLAFQGGLIFIAYVVSILVNLIVAYLEISSIYKEYSHYIHSILALAYLVVSIYIMIRSLMNDPPIEPLVDDLIEDLLK